MTTVLPTDSVQLIPSLC